MNHPIQNLPTDLPTDRHYPRNRIVSAGFTIVELLIVIVVIGILAAMTLVAYNGIQQKARDGGVMTDLHGLGFLETQYALLNNAPGKDWYSGNGIDSSLNFKPSPGNIIDVVTNATGYCIRAYNPGSATYKTLATAATRESAPGACSVIVASAAAVAAGDVTTFGWATVVGGAQHTCALDTNKRVSCWGWNGSGQLGNNTIINSKIPVAVDTSGVLSGKTVISIGAGGDFSCVVTSDGKAYCWGINNLGQLGNNSTIDSKIPVAVDTNGLLSGKTALSIVASGTTACVIASDSKAYCWGDGGQGQFGNNTTTTSMVPVAAANTGAMIGKTVVAISMGQYGNVCAIASDNLAYCWGYNGYGVLGNRAIVTPRSLVPVAVETIGVLSGKTITAISAGLDHTCAIASDSKDYCWGYGNNGALGNNSTVTNYGIPVAVDTSGVLSGKTITALAGYSNTCAIASDSKAYCWGYNGYGQLGNNSTTNSLVPLAVNTSGVLSGKMVTSISSSASHTCVTTSDKQAACWGENWSSGNLGNNSTVDSLIPVTVLPPATP